MASVRELAHGLDRSYGTTLRRLRGGAYAEAVKERGRWKVPAYYVQDAYAERADAFFQARRAIPLDAHYPNPELRYRFTYQFVYTILLHFEDGTEDERTDFSWLIVVRPGERKPSSRRLWALIRDMLDQLYLGPTREDEIAYDLEDRKVVGYDLLDAHVVRAQRKG